MRSALALFLLVLVGCGGTNLGPTDGSNVQLSRQVKGPDFGYWFGQAGRGFRGEVQLQLDGQVHVIRISGASTPSMSGSIQISENLSFKWEKRPRLDGTGATGVEVNAGTIEYEFRDENRLHIKVRNASGHRFFPSAEEAYPVPDLEFELPREIDEESIAGLRSAYIARADLRVEHLPDSSIGGYEDGALLIGPRSGRRTDHSISLELRQPNMPRTQIGTLLTFKRYSYPDSGIFDHQSETFFSTRDWSPTQGWHVQWEAGTVLYERDSKLTFENVQLRFGSGWHVVLNGTVIFGDDRVLWVDILGNSVR